MTTIAKLTGGDIEELISVDGGRSETAAEAKAWQVFFFPSNNQFIAYCPFTRVFSQGSSVESALLNWIQTAQETFHRQFSITPRYLIDSRKVLYGERGLEGEGVFLLDWRSVGKYFIVSPTTHITACVSKQWAQLAIADETSTPAEVLAAGLIPRTVIDVAIRCTPPMPMPKPSLLHDRCGDILPGCKTISLTPNLIN